MDNEHNCDDALAEGFVAGLIRGRDVTAKKIRHALIDTGDVAFHLNDVLAIIEEVVGAF